MLSKFSDLYTLGVINITPNSFSDPKKYLDNDLLLSTLKNFSSNKNLILDFGFESTAPMNSAVSLEEERERFDKFFEVIRVLDLSHHWISIDTYKIDNYRYFEEQFKRRYHNCGFIFNDVSGVCDLELKEFLMTKKNVENFYYLHSYTNVPDRDQVLKHMSFVENGDIAQMTIAHFKKSYQWFKNFSFEEKLLFDPCFGFSKSYEQNWDLIKNFSKVLCEFNQSDVIVPWVIGVSKKSFLRKALNTDSFLETEKLHQEIITEFFQMNKNQQLIIRAHDPMIVEGARKLNNA